MKTSHDVIKTVYNFRKENSILFLPTTPTTKKGEGGGTCFCLSIKKFYSFFLNFFYLIWIIRSGFFVIEELIFVCLCLRIEYETISNVIFKLVCSVVSFGPKGIQKKFRCVYRWKCTCSRILHLSLFSICVFTPQWGAADAEIKSPIWWEHRA